MRIASSLALCLSLALVACGGNRAVNVVPTVEPGTRVSLEYTVRLDDGTEAGSNIGSEPLTFVAGEQQVMPGIEKAVLGLKLDESKSFTLSPEDGYGPVDPEAFQLVEHDAIPEDSRHAGALLVVQDKSGGKRPVRVLEVREDGIMLDLNHPLAGETLNLEVRVLSIE